MGGVDVGGFQYGQKMKTPSCELVVIWVVVAYWMLDLEKCKNAWKIVRLECVL